MFGGIAYHIRSCKIIGFWGIMNYAIDASEDCRTMLPKLHIEVVFTSAYIDTTGGSAYGGHMEIFDVSDARKVGDREGFWGLLFWLGSSWNPLT